MPAMQRGSTDKKRGSWRARWNDEHGRPREKRGFRTKSEARRFLDGDRERGLIGELERVRRARAGELAAELEIPTFEALVDEYLAQHHAEANTIRTLTARLGYAKRTFGPLRIDRLTVPEIKAWRKHLPEGSAWHIHKALRQVLNYAVAAGYVPENVARKVANPEPRRKEIPAFAAPSEVDAVAGELEAAYRAIPILAAETGLRPEEWIALERREVEIDRTRGTGVLHVRRVFTDGRVQPYGKTDGSVRTVALTKRAIAALDAMPRRLDSQLLFPSAKGAHIDLHWFRREKWGPAVTAAGVPKRSPYALRHTYATWAIAAGIPTFSIAKRMGTSVEQIEKTYGHLLPTALDTERAALEAWQAAQATVQEALWDDGLRP